ncbi:hypothetical protein Ancab_038805 [Ancistrocladus abbreviatus]
MLVWRTATRGFNYKRIVELWQENWGLDVFFEEERLVTSRVPSWMRWNWDGEDPLTAEDNACLEAVQGAICLNTDKRTFIGN